MLPRIILCELLVFVALFVVDAAAPRTSEAGESTGIVRGVVYWDMDGDGEQDADEPGILTNPVLSSPDGATPLVTGFADDDGSYEMDAEPGTYRLSPGVAVAFEECAGVPLPSYNPFGFRDCVGADYPITSERLTEPFELAAGETVEIDFPVTTRDEMILLGRAITDDGNAPAGTVIRAVNNGTECGSATVEGGGSPGGGPGDFVLRALGADQRDGCYVPGDNVVFELDGMEAGEAWSYVRFSPVPSQNGEYGRDGVATIDISFLEQHAWYWSDDRRSVDGAPFPQGTPVRAIFPGDVVCGETEIGDVESARGELSGFGRLLVKSAELQPGCGTFGGTFDIVIGDEVAYTGAYWDSALFQLCCSAPVIDDPQSPPPYPCPIIVPDASPSPPATFSDSWPQSPPLSPPPFPYNDRWLESPPPVVAGVAALQESPPSSAPESYAIIGQEPPLSPPELSPPPATPSSPPVCYAPAAGGINPPDTGSAGLKARTD